MSLSRCYALDYKCTCCAVRFLVDVGDDHDKALMPDDARSVVHASGAVEIAPACPLCGQRCGRTFIWKREPLAPDSD